MDETLNQLEREVNADLSRLAGELGAAPPADVVRRLKAAVRLEVDAAWLAARPHPLPSREAVAAVRAAVHSTLRQERSTPAGRSLRLPFRGAAAAAALIALCAGLVNFAARSPRSPVGGVVTAVPDDPAIRLFVQANRRVMAGDQLTDAMDEDLTSLEQNLAEWESAWGAWDQSTDEAEDEPDGQSWRREAPFPPAEGSPDGPQGVIG